MTIWTLRADGGPTPQGQAVDSEMVRAALGVLVDPRHGFQLQYSPWPGGWGTFAGNEINLAVEWVEKYGREAEGMYYALNPVNANIGRRLLVGDVLRRRWLFIDVDRAKTDESKKLSAADAEHEAAQVLASDVSEWLTTTGWPAPVVIDSGNGWHLLYRIDLPNDDESRILVRDCLKSLAKSFDGERGTLGKECHDARRIAKLPGTWARKGPNSADRPHRLCRLTYAPDSPVVLTPDLIRKATKQEKTYAAAVNGHAFTVRAEEGADKVYARAALDSECGRMALTKAGDLNNQLFRSGANMGEFVGAGLLTEDEVYQALTRAAQAAGCDDPHKDADTLRRSIKKGKENPRQLPESVKAKAGDQKKQSGPAVKPVIHRMTDLLDMDLPPPNWAVPGIMSEGLTILAGKPKLGKSWMALALGLTIAGGGMALGTVRVVPGDVLYLSLEDRLRRIQDRAKKVLAGVGCDVSRRLCVSTHWPRQRSGGLEEIEEWLTKAERPALVIIDVWQKFRPAYRQGSQYEQDYDAATELKSLADKYNTSSLIVHHCKKGEAEDVVEEISGTLGLSGAADGMLILSRARESTDGKLFITGRDVDDHSLALEFDKKTFCWRSLGDSALVTDSKIKKAVVGLFQLSPGSSYFTGEIAERVGHPEGSVRTTLYRLEKDGIVRHVGKKWTWPVEPTAEF